MARTGSHRAPAVGIGSAGPPARQLLDQPPQHGQRVGGPHRASRYVLDQAEIPTVQERSLGPAGVLAKKRAEVDRRLMLLVDGRRVALVSAGRPQLSFPDGAGGLKTTRMELPLASGVDHPHRVELHDGTFPGRIGWKAVVSAPGKGTAVRSDAPTGDPTAACAAIRRTCCRGRSTAATRTLRSRPAAERWRRPRASTAERPRRARRRGGWLRRPVRGRRLRSGRVLCCCWRPLGGAPCTPCRRGTARRWWPPTWLELAAARGTRSRSARRSR